MTITNLLQSSMIKNEKSLQSVFHFEIVTALICYHTNIRQEYFLLCSLHKLNRLLMKTVNRADTGREKQDKVGVFGCGQVS